MRVLRFLPLPLVATVAAIACQDGKPSPFDAAPPVLAVVQHGNSGAHASIPIPPRGGFTSELLARGTITDDVDIQFRLKMAVTDHSTMVSRVSTPSDVVMGKITFQPGGALPWHTHPGPVIVTVKTGELTLVRADNCQVYKYGAGQSFVDPGNGMVHVAFNATQSETILYATYLGVPAGSPTLIEAANPGC